MRLLIIEDDLILLDLLATGLSSDFEIDFATNWLKAKQLLGKKNYRVVILKQSLAETEEIDLKQFLDQDSLAFLLMVDGLACVLQLENFKGHVHDFIIKPFTLDQLSNKLKSLFPPESVKLMLAEKNIIKLDKSVLILNENRQSIFYKQQSLRLNRKEFALLNLLIKREGQVLSKIVLSNLIWGNDLIVFSNTIATYVASLRRKLRKIDCPQRIKTIRGGGYFWSNN